jgi:tetratricopeptide (TPR) repeat protein
MTSILRNYTTIPPHLYVHRAADHQLRKILNEMDRPGYVLVARQMGKTNLLFNAKRELESSNTLFAYVDLSNYFSEERECYRNIIDCILDPNEELFANIADSIHANRMTGVLPAHKEHLKELRMILKFFTGKLIIILDEIDALKNAPYSDHIFAQIRSNYFARTNYPELHNLTYILSGVIEPTELIKDKNKSPFNIGEKIYLDDFSLPEFKKFLEKSGLNIKEDIIEYVYGWTSGNPRLTFDICVEISGFLSENTEITNQIIDHIIEKKYLTAFDIAPVDHIREVVKDNPSLRKAVQKLHRNIVDDLDDEIKQKLYLFGVTNHDSGTKPLKIKNKILEKSLSQEWLNSLDNKAKSLFDLGVELILDEHNYTEGAKHLEDYLSGLTKPSDHKSLAEYYLGYAYHHAGNFTESNRYLKPEPMKFITSPDMHYRQKLYIGLNHISQNQVEEGTAYLEEVIDKHKKGSPYANALLNLSQTIIEENFEDSYPRGLELLDLLIDEVDLLNFDDDSDVSSHEFATLALSSKSAIHLKIDEKELAQDCLKKALEVCEPSFKPALFIKLFEQTHDSKLINDLADSILNNGLKFDKIRQHSLTFSEKLLNRSIQIAFFSDNLNAFESLVDYAHVINGHLEKAETCYRISISANRVDFALKLYEHYIFGEERTEQSIMLKMFRRLTLLSWNNKKDFKSYFSNYLILFRTLSSRNIDVADLNAFNLGIRSYFDLDKISEAIELCTYVETRLVNLDEELTHESVIIYYWTANLYHTNKDRTKSLEYVDKALEILDDSQIETGSIIDQKGRTLILERMNFIKNNFAVRVPILNGVKYGRNDKVNVKYSDGLVVEGKYKKFEVDIKDGKCVIV